MSWQGEITTVVRHIIDDVDPDNYSYTDSRLEKAILVAAQIVASEVDFETTYVIDVEQCYLNPDPTDPTTGLATADKDDGFINLIALKAACLILGSEFKTQGLNAISVTDGPSSINMTAIAQNMKFLYEKVCADYEKYKFNHAAGTNAVGKAILSPYSPGSDAASRSHYWYGHFR